MFNSDFLLLAHPYLESCKFSDGLCHIDCYDIAWLALTCKHLDDT